MNIAIAGTGYVGMSLAVLLSRQNSVKAVDIIPEKISMINERKSPIADTEIEEYLTSHTLDLIATSDAESAYSSADYIIIATPTNYDVSKNEFDTSSVEAVLSIIEKVNSGATVVIKSTIPVGFVENTIKKFAIPNILFSPEFLREGRALYDNLHPSRIIVGVPISANAQLKEKAERFANLLQDAALDKDIPTLFVNATEAESIKLFANTYLAMRVAFFNELDSYAEKHGLNSQDIIRGVCFDPRIGAHYNNPSFGYGGYCLPKDTRQLLANFHDTPNALISAIVDANEIRMNFVADQIKASCPKVVGIYRLIMKTGSDNFRASAIQGIIRRLSQAGIQIIIYEPSCADKEWEGFEVIQDLKQWKTQSDIIVANRNAPELADVSDKVYCRDVFGNN